jgi:hypothetical protein
MPLIRIALTIASQPAATRATTPMSFTRSGANSCSVATAAGIVPDTMNTAEETSTVQPHRKPSVGLKIEATQA